jgi:hypothetical protein
MAKKLGIRLSVKTFDCRPRLVILFNYVTINAATIVSHFLPPLKSTQDKSAKRQASLKSGDCTARLEQVKMKPI